jgi:hypothetical protein
MLKIYECMKDEDMNGISITNVKYM